MGETASVRHDPELLLNRLFGEAEVDIGKLLLEAAQSAEPRPIAESRRTVNAGEYLVVWENRIRNRTDMLPEVMSKGEPASDSF